jgi:antitoxin ParD1/3/4
MNVRLTPEQEELVERLVLEGRYPTVSEAIHAGLQLLERELAWKADARMKIQEGLDDLKAGRVVDGEKAIEEILAKLKRRKRRKRA